eukprot:CAMPEP_0174744466 /NCGR_PEP_ID=MMETSP1094-20130205/84434_1 /TAXON_ID=156173 /ORGANISM="Chrysochromulina brevifilum, Strain UTEX LB 985" /LENGTH=52 /DNA_ID=CAMNT_0015948861 /DNA_START=225 /DNA_END=380 /DNA_ORIENTATION=-
MSTDRGAVRAQGGAAAAEDAVSPIGRVRDKGARGVLKAQGQAGLWRAVETIG